MINDAWGACVAAAVAATGVKDTVPYPELFVNVTAAVLGAAMCGIYVASARYWRKNIGQRLPGLWQILGLAGVLSLVCWMAPRALFPSACWENQPFPMAGLIVALCLYAATVAVTTRGCSRGEKLLAVVVGCLMLPCASVLLAAGIAEILFLEASHIWRHLLALSLVWVEVGMFMTLFWYASMRREILKNGELLRCSGC
jgi:hypothetical protein